MREPRPAIPALPAPPTVAEPPPSQQGWMGGAGPHDPPAGEGPISTRGRGRFFGRAADLLALADRFEQGARLVTITGPAGMGKTTLARRHAERTRPITPTIFCDLTGLQDEEALCRALGKELDLVPESLTGGRGGSVIGLALAARGSMLIVLDNFERLVPSATRSITRWIEGSQALFFVTSRERLRLAYEAVLDLQPLDAGEALFLQRMREAGALADPDMADPAVVRAIVERLDGIPLAIELAAARTRILGLTQLLARLEQRFAVLAAPADDKPAHHATMYEAVAWSWTQLEPYEQLALSVCAVFDDAFTLDAAEHVLAEQWPPGAPPIFSAFEALRDKSLLRIVRPATPSDVPRFTAYETIREFAADQLRRSGLAEELQDRHAAYYLKLAERVDLSIVRGAWAEVPQDIARKRQNYQSILDRAAASGDPRSPIGWAGLRAAVILDATSEGAGLRQAELAATEALITLLGDQAPPADLAAAHLVCAVNQKSGTGHDRALAHASEALALAQRIEDPGLVGLARSALGEVLLDVGRLDEALPILEIARRAHRKRGDWVALIQTMRTEANAFHSATDLVEARRRYEDILRASAQHGLPFGTMLGEAGLGTLHLERGLLDLALGHYQNALAIAGRIGARRNEMLIHGYIGLLYFDRGDLAAAEESLRRALVLSTAAGYGITEGNQRAVLGAVLASLGRGEEAEVQLDKARSRLASHLFWGRVAIIHHGHLDLWHAREHEARGNHKQAEIHRAAASARAAAAHTEDSELAACGGPKRAIVNISDDARIAARILNRAIAASAPPKAIEPESSPTPRPARVAGPPGRLVAAADGSWFEVGDGGLVSLERRTTLRTLLGALVDLHQRSPGAGLSSPDLIAICWPGERLQRTSALNRLRVAFSTLRDLGLRDVVIHDRRGYLLDPTHTISIASASLRSGPATPGPATQNKLRAGRL
ncbi:MAG: tetratricopeptide repeat protein [Byssovorax sp.]